MKRVNRRYDDALSRQNWRDFERLLADHYRREGFQVEHCGTGAAGSRYDGGIDLKLRRGDEYIVVECKHWNVMQVPHNVVHQLMGIMVNEGATGAILVTSGEFTPYAKDAANKLGHVQLVDGEALRKILGPELVVPDGVESAMANWAPIVRRRDTQPSGDTHWGLIAAILVTVALLWLAIAKLKSTVEEGVLPTSNAAAVPRATAAASPQPQRAGEPLDPLKTAGRIAAIQGAAVMGDQRAVESQMQGFQEEFRKSIKLPDQARRIDREAARALAKRVPGVRSVNWVDHENLLAIVLRNDQRSYATIDAICAELAPLGDTLGVVVNLQSAAARNGAELEILSRNCQLRPGERAFAQANRRMDVLSPSDRARYEAGRVQMSAEDLKKQKESMKALEANTKPMEW